MAILKEREREGLTSAGHEHAHPETEAMAGPGMRQLMELMRRGKPAPDAVARIVAANPGEEGTITCHCHEHLGNHFVTEVFQSPTARAAPTQVADTPPAPGPGPAQAPDPAGPLGPSAEVDPAEVVREQLAHGQHDEIQLANEAFWRLQPALRGIKLKAGTPAAQEWLRMRDEFVRPALEQAQHARKKEEHKATHPPKPAVSEEQPVAAPPTPAPAPAIELGKDAGPALREAADGKDKDKDKDHEPAKQGQAPAPAVQPGQEAEPAKGKTAPTPELQALLDWSPVGMKGPQGQAAWLLAAIETKLIAAFGETKTQLKQLADGEDSVTSIEQEPDKVRSPLKNVKRVGGKGAHTKYEIDVDGSPILGVLVTMSASRIHQWIDEGAKKVHALFTLGTMARGDLGFSFASRHATGEAIDLGLDNFKTDKDVVELLDGLEPGKVGSVFPDNNNHVHLAVHDGKYEFGLPFQGSFFPLDKKIEKVQDAAEKAQGDPEVGTTIKVEGLDKYSSHWSESTGKYLGEGKWKWSKPKAAGGKASSHLKSGPLKALLAKLGDGPTGGAAKAASDDGHADAKGH